jgi:hypothetical protein
LGLVFLTGWLIWRNRRDALIVIYGLLPLILGGLGLALSSAPRVQTWLAMTDLSILQVFSRFSVPFDGLNIIALALIFLVKSRNARWASLAVYGLILGSWIAGSQVVLLIWIVIPLLIVFLGWWLDRYKRHQLKFTN